MNSGWLVAYAIGLMAAVFRAVGFTPAAEIAAVSYLFAATLAFSRSSRLADPLQASAASKRVIG